MEYLEGETLAQRLEKGPLTLTQTLQTEAEIASALDRVPSSRYRPSRSQARQHHAHQGRRKAARFRIVQSNRVTCRSTLGISRGFHSKSRLPASSSAPSQYMAPEQFEGNPADARADIFAFGAVFYECCRRPKRSRGTVSRA